MEKANLVSKEIASVIDILEQIQDVNRMLEIHKDDEDDLMLNQFQYRKENFLKELKNLLKDFDISPTDLAA